MATGGPAATITYLAYRAASAVANTLPESLARPSAKAAGRLLGMAMRGRREMLGRHLRRVHGDGLSGRELDRAVDRAFESYGRYWLEVFRLARETPETLRDRLEVEGLEHVHAALAGGRGVIIAVPHLGNWDLGGAWFAAQGYRPATVMEPIEPPALFEWFMSLRQAFGLEIVALGPNAGSAMLRVLREGRMVGLMCDRDLGGRGIEVEFFGERTTLPSGPATLALRSGAPILAAAAYFGTGRRHLCIMRPPIPVERRGSVREDSMRITQAVATELEELIRRAPDQWHLLQPNWPSDFAAAGVERRVLSRSGAGRP